MKNKRSVVKDTCFVYYLVPIFLFVQKKEKWVKLIGCSMSLSNVPTNTKRLLTMALLLLAADRRSRLCGSGAPLYEKLVHHIESLAKMLLRGLLGFCV